MEVKERMDKKEKFVIVAIVISLISLIFLFVFISRNGTFEVEEISDICITFKDFQVSEPLYNDRGLYTMNFTIENCGNMELTNIFVEHHKCYIDLLLPNAEKRVSYVNWTGPHPSWGSINPGCERSYSWYLYCRFFWTCDQLQEKWKDRDPTVAVKPVRYGNETYIMAYVNFWRSSDCSFADQCCSFSS